MKEKVLFWLLSVIFILSCICLLLLSVLTRQPDLVYVNDISDATIAAENIPLVSEDNIVSPVVSSEPTAALININTASKEELESLSGIGDAYAERIIEYREQMGGFDSIEEIMEISGIGESKFEAIKDLITI